MKKESRGFVLIQRNSVASIIDEYYGRIYAHSFNSLSTGGFYAYQIEKTNTWYTIMYEEIIDLPEHIVIHNIFFLHHLFEITIRCTPVSSYVRDIFLFFLWLYSKNPDFFTQKNKKYVVFRLLTYLDMWPFEPIRYSLLLKIAQIPIDQVSQATLDLISDEILNQWLNDDFFNNGLYKKLKTKPLLHV